MRDRSRRMMLFLLFLGFFLAPAASRPAAAARGACPPGSRPVEDIASGKILCEKEDALDSRTLRRRRGREVGRPGVPRAPGRPGAPRAPRAPKEASSPVGGDCGLERWGCEQACWQTYVQALAAGKGQTAQRAKVAFDSCLAVCAREFDCPARAPETPVKK